MSKELTTGASFSEISNQELARASGGFGQAEADRRQRASDAHAADVNFNLAQGTGMGADIQPGTKNPAHKIFGQ